MAAWISARYLVATALALSLLARAAPAGADLRISELDLLVKEHDVTVHIVLLDAIPPGFSEGLQSGIPAHIRFTVELWQYNRTWRDSLILRRVIERDLAYNVVTREFKVVFADEGRPAHATRDLHDAERVACEVAALRLVPPAALDPAELFYVRVRAESALNGENTFLTRLAGTAEQAVRQSDYRTITRVP